MITRFNNVKMSTDSSDPNYYIVTEDSVSTPENTNLIFPSDMDEMSIITIGNKDHETE